MKPKIAVLGSASGSLSSDQHAKAYAVGAAIARLGGVVLTGACPGLPHDATIGALSSNGLTIGISPAAHLDAHLAEFGYPTDSSLLIFTGMGRKGRNVILVRSADACIFVGGGMGTLNEFTIALDELGADDAIGILLGSGGIADELPRLLSNYGASSGVPVIQESDPARLVERVFAHLDTRGGQ
ncbi:MAG: LOG family protein [Desulfomonilaceae bacterium]